MRPFARLIACVLVSALIPATAFAEDALPLRVGRITLAEAGAGLRAGAGAWTNAVVNEPVMTGWSLRSGTDGRAEIRLAGIRLALAPGTEIAIVRLAEDRVQIALRQGRIGLRLGPRATGQRVQIETARGTVRPSAPGEYDIEAGAADGPLRIAVFAGDARLDGGGAVAAGREEVLAGAATPLTAAGPATADGFAEWWRSRDDDPAAASPPGTGLAAMPGAGALAGNGEWRASADYGPVWYPATLPDGWAPFRYGTWRWLPPWGWTWIDDAPWGFAPSHYGRWVRIDRSWGWAPGTGTAPPAYVPAVVAFLGTPGIGLSYSGGSGPAEAWFPLGPGEVYWPPRSQDIAAIRRMNAGSGADMATLAPGPGGNAPAAVVNGDYRYRRFASAVPHAVFVGVGPVTMSLVQIPERRLAVAPVLPGGPQIAPPAPRPPAAHPPAPHPSPKVAAAHVAAPPHRVAASDREKPRHIAVAAHPHPPRHLRVAAAAHPHAPIRLDVAPPRPGHAKLRAVAHPARPPAAIRLPAAAPHPSRRRHLAAARVVRQ